jgi:predicted neuraminidase
MPANTPAAHASSLLAMPRDSAATLLAFWFAGARESAPDVQIAFSWFERASQQWQPARFVLSKEAAGAALGFGVRRLGNPVAWLDASQRVHLFVVATGLGGWAAGRVLHLVQKAPFRHTAKDFDAIEFEAKGVLPLSWLWNTSHLVRSAPLGLADGGMLLPLYFELGIKYPLAARFGPQGEFRGTQRISARNGLLQPSLVMQSDRQWLALLRDHSPQRKVAVAATDDAGQHWRDLPDLVLDNPDASVAGLGLYPGQMVLAYNPSSSGRESLALSASVDGTAWQALGLLAEGPVGREFSYPAMAVADGALWVSFTDQRQRIAWQRWALPAGPVGRAP